MQFDVSEEQRAIRELVRDFAKRHLAPVVEECEAQERFPRHLLPLLGDLDILRVGYPVQHGGISGGLVEQCIVIQEFARVNAGFASGLATSYVVPRLIAAIGTPTQIEAYAEPLVRGRTVAAFALTEPDAGSDARSIRTRAVRDGDTYVLNGSKMFVSNATIADFSVVVAYTDHSKGIDGMSLFLVEAGTPGWDITQKLKKEAVKTNETSAVTLDSCRVPAANILGGEGTGFRRAMEFLNADRMFNCARSIGIAEASFEAALRYANERKQFGKAIGGHQAIAFKLADMFVKLEAARLLEQRASWLYDAGRPCVREIAIAKLYASEICGEVARDAVQIHGGYGLMSDFPVARYLRDSLLQTVGAGTSEIQRRIIARQLELPIA